MTAASSTTITRCGECFPCKLLEWLRTTVVPEHSRDSFAAATTPTPTTTPMPMPTTTDYAKDYRAFILVHHATHGYMLLHCTRKKNKPHHFQLPGGHVDDFELKNATTLYPNQPAEQLQEAAKRGAARELYEETGMDVRQQLKRLEPTRLYAKGENDRKGLLENEFKQRLFFTLRVTDEDFLRQDMFPISEAAFLKKPLGQSAPKLMLKLSHEHQGFAFEKYLDVAATLLQHHSGGKISDALKMSLALQNEQPTTNAT